MGKLLCICIVVMVIQTCHSINLRPVIGVWTEPWDDSYDGTEFINAGYVKFIESVGGRAVPLSYKVCGDGGGDVD